MCQMSNQTWDQWLLSLIKIPGNFWLKEHQVRSTLIAGRCLKLANDYKSQQGLDVILPTSHARYCEGMINLGGRFLLHAIF